MAQSIVFKKDGVAINELAVTLADFTGGKYVTDEINIGNFDSAAVNVVYADVVPDRTPPTGNQLVNYKLQATVETAGSDGFWYPLATQLTGYNSTENANKIRIEINPKVGNFNQGVENILPLGSGEGVRVTSEQGHVSDNMRVCVHLGDDPGATSLPFQSVNLTIQVLLYNS